MIEKNATSERVLNPLSYSKILRANLSKPTTLISFSLLLLITFCAIFAPFLAPTNPYDLAIVTIMDGRLAPA